MKNIDILKDVKKIDTIETNVNQAQLDITKNTTDITSIQTDLSVTENTKYTTVNGVKEFECGNGYIDNINIEGKTLVNLAPNTTPVNNISNNRVQIQDDNVQQLKSGVNYTLVNNSSRIVYLTSYSGIQNDTVQIPPNSKKLYSAKGDFKYNYLLGNYADGWSDTNKTELKNIVVLEGDYTSKTIPYFEGLKSIGQGDKIEVLSCTDGNMIDLNNIVEGYYVSKTNAIVTESNSFYCNYLIEITPNMKISLKNEGTTQIGLFRYLDSKKTFISAEELSSNTLLNIPINAKYLGISFYNRLNIKETLYVGTGDSKQNYLYKSDKKQILTTLRSLPNGVKDEIVKQGDKYYKVNKCEEYNYNDLGNITYIYNESSKFSQFHMVFNKTFKNNIISNLLPSLGNYDGLTVFVHPSNSNTIVIRVPINYNTVDLVKPYLSSSNFTFVVELENPMIEELPNFNPRCFSDKSTILLNSGVVQGEASFEVTNSTRSELEVLKGKVSDLDDYTSDDTVEVINITPLNGIRVGGNGVCRLVKTKNTTKFVAELVSDVNIPTGTIICKLPSINKFIPIFAHCIDNKVYRCWLYDDNYLKVYGTAIPANTVFYFNVELI